MFKSKIYLFRENRVYQKTQVIISKEKSSTQNNIVSDVNLHRGWPNKNGPDLGKPETAQPCL